jgi:hypothetical protein
MNEPTRGPSGSGYGQGQDMGNPRVAFWAATLTAGLAAVSFAVAVTTPPRTGPFAAPGSALAYPYSAAAEFVPRDFRWMYPAVLMMLAYLVLAACIRSRASGTHGLFGSIGQSLAIVSFAVITIDYFIQLQTIQPGLLRGEGADLVALSQYNPHSVFIALETLGYLVMGFSFLFLGLSLGRERLQRATRWVLVVSFALSLLAFVGMSLYYGLNLEYRFEVAALTIDWLTLAAAGVLLALAFRRSGEAH